MTELTMKPNTGTAQAEMLPAAGQKSERNMGVELFRIVSMMLVILLHVMGHGGVLYATKHLSANYEIARFFETLGYCAVNCYAIISGFANVKTKFKFRRFLFLWLETVVLILAITSITHFFIPSVEVQKEWWLGAILPLTRRELWYLCAYFFMYPLLPLINKGLLSIGRWQHIAIIVWLQVPTLFKLIMHEDNYGLGGGYSAIWLICLYVLGAYFRIYGAPKWAKWFVTLPVFFLSAFAAWFKIIYIEKQAALGLIAKDSVQYDFRDDWVSYVSPFMVIMATMLLLFFMQLNIKGKPIKLLIANFAKATWGVFVLHVCSAGWEMDNGWQSLRKIATLPAWKMVLACFGAVLAIWFVTSIITMFKNCVFDLLRINKGINFLCDLPARIVNKIKEKRSGGKIEE